MNAAATNAHSDVIKSVLKDALEYCCPKITRDSGIQSARQDMEKEFPKNLGHVMLTVSGIEFCAITFLHYQCGENAKNSYLTLHEAEGVNPTEKDWDAFYTELGNHLCGRIKNYFHRQFDHLGMSTPWILSPTTDLFDLNTHQLFACGHLFYTCNSIPVIGASLHVYSSCTLDFPNPINDSNEPSNSGELEFF
jgi:hypothetical protein